MSEHQGVMLVNNEPMRIAFALFLCAMNLLRRKRNTVSLVIIQACLVCDVLKLIIIYSPKILQKLLLKSNYLFPFLRLWLSNRV
jgi:hypothetical protein